VKILIVNRFFGGAQIPTGRMAEDVAHVLVAEGHEVVALASTGTYAGAEKRAQHGARSIEQGGNAQAQDQQIERLTDQETKRPKEEKTGALRVETVGVPKWMPRAVAWLWFTWQARKRIPRMHWDVCVLMTDPPLLPLLVLRVARLKDQKTKRLKDSRVPRSGRRRVAVATNKTERRVAVWLMDLYPEALAASGRLSERNPLYQWYFNKRQRALAEADLLICLGEEQTKRLETKRPKDQESQTAVAFVPPWDDRGNIALATEESLRNLALYAGNLGEAHCFEEILAAAPHLPSDWTIRFAVRGAKLSALQEKAKGISHGLTRIDTDSFVAGDTGDKSSSPETTTISGATVQVTGYASEEETPGLLASARVHLITMSPGWEGIVVPSKLYGCIRTGRPVLFIGPENADTAQEIRAHDWGAVLPPGASGEDVAAAIMELAARATKPPLEQRGAAEVAELIKNLATAEHRETA